MHLEEEDILVLRPKFFPNIIITKVSRLKQKKKISPRQKDQIIINNTQN